MADDWIRIRQIRLYGYHGLYTYERTRGQFFEIDVDLCADLNQAGVSDSIEETVDYVEVYRIVEHVVTGSPKYLLEAVAETIACEILRQFSVRRVVIRIRKPGVQMPGTVGTVEIEITRP